MAGKPAAALTFAKESPAALFDRMNRSFAQRIGVRSLLFGSNSPNEIFRHEALTSLLSDPT